MEESAIYFWKVKFNADKTELLCIGKNMEDFNLRFGDSINRLLYYPLNHTNI